MAAPAVACSCILLACCLGILLADARSYDLSTDTLLTEQQQHRHQARSTTARSLMHLASRKQRVHLEVSSPDPTVQPPEAVAAPHGQEVSTARPGAYLAMCLVVRDQSEDLREWVEYHRALGAGKFYIFDDNSTAPARQEVSDLVEAGVVDCETIEPSSSPIKHLQLHIYDTCIQRYRDLHQWIAFVDADEFFVLRDPRAATLPELLRDYEEFGGLAVNWQMFGSSGHLSRPNGSTLAAYTACFPQQHLENHHVKTIANMAWVDSVSGDPHHFRYKDGKQAVNTAREVVEGARAEYVRPERLLLHHYVTKSLGQYAGKMARGSAMGNRKSMEFFDLVQREAVARCTHALHLGRR